MRARARRCVSSLRASSSGVTFWYFLFFAILVLQELSDLPHLVVDVGEQAHDSRDVAVLDRRFDECIVVMAPRIHKILFGTDDAFADGADAGRNRACTGYG
jgi:hypothetical protein